MIGKRGKTNGQCPLCGGSLSPGVATIPFLLKGAVVVVKDVPAEICAECDEPFLAGVATDEVLRLLTGLRSLNTEVSVLTYPRAAHGRQVEPNAATAAVR